MTGGNGTASTTVHDVGGDFVILDDGSGSLRVSGIGGRLDDRS